MDESKSYEVAQNFSFNSLETMRKKLLDLTARNKLLNYKHPQKSCLRIVDELPNQIAEMLKSEQKLTFLSVDEPTDRLLEEKGYTKFDIDMDKIVALKTAPTGNKWLGELGFSPEYNLTESQENAPVAEKHFDRFLQTEQFQKSLDAILKKMTAEANSMMEESGADILFLCIGFLEWFEDGNSTKKRLAPLYILPVRIEKSKKFSKKGKFEYSISIKDDQIINNITLKEKLLLDFELDLPDVLEDDSPEEYLSRVSETILHHKPRWSIKRYATIALLNFTKQVMYNDLNPDKWPKEKPLEKHPIIADFFAEEAVEVSEKTFKGVQEYPIDSLEEIHDKYPVIYDADSSQHSALIDALDGRNLVIEGPPGTGKSQTITNLIAAAIANGKKVLFVAEKMAALKVVYKRLENAGFASFCLELHSYNTNKASVFSSLQERLSMQEQFQNPTADRNIVQRYETYKNNLNSYVNALNTPWKKTEKTAHQIFNKAVLLREKQKNLDFASIIPGISGATFTPMRESELTDAADQIISIYRQIAKQTRQQKIEEHFWYGFDNHDFQSIQAPNFISDLNIWSESIKNKMIHFKQLFDHHKVPYNYEISFNEFEEILRKLQKLPVLQGKELLKAVDFLYLQKENFSIWLKEYRRIYLAKAKYTKIFNIKSLENKETFSKIQEDLESLKNSGFDDSKSLKDLSSIHEKLQSCLKDCIATKGLFNEIRESLPEEMKICFEVSSNGLNEFFQLMKHLNSLENSMWKHRSVDYCNDEIDAFLEAARETFINLEPLKKRLSTSFHIKEIPSKDRLQEIDEIFSNAGLFRFFSSDWRLAKKEMQELSKRHKPRTNELSSELPTLIAYTAKVEKLESLFQKHPISSQLFKGVDTDYFKIEKMRNWYKNIQKDYGVAFGKRVSIGKTLLELDTQLVIGLKTQFSEQMMCQIENIISIVSYCKQSFSGRLELQGEWSDIQARVEILQGELKTLLDRLEEVIRSENISMIDLKSLIAEIKVLKVDENTFLNSNITDYFVLNYPAQFSNDLFVFSEHFYQALLETDVLANFMIEHELQKEFVTALTEKDSYLSLKESISKVGDLQEKEIQARQLILEKWGINFSKWLISSKAEISGVLLKNEDAVKNQEILPFWVDYLNLKRKYSAVGMGELLKHLESTSLEITAVKEVLLFSCYQQLADEIFKENEQITSVSGMEQESSQQKFREYDQKLLEYQRRSMAFRAAQIDVPSGISSGKVGNYTEMGLIKHNLSLKKPRIKLRKFLEKSRVSLQALKPCFMMSPMSVAQYLKAGVFEFDLVVMDEASQIRPEDALGAIARGKNLIVVGDPKQLPPTSFFQKTSSDQEYDEENNAIEDNESILDAVMPTFRNRRLRWHYRSRHESLIEFSNYHFYDGNLVVFPSPTPKESGQLGIDFRFIENSVFLNSVNPIESEEVVKVIVEHLLGDLDNSIGVVAMNVKQRDDIQERFDTELRNNPLLRNAYEKNLSKNDDLFIKNLENVQGDERDIMLLSMTYGPNQAGAHVMAQRFGPINNSGGWRRLNVLFTRAKKKMIVFSSMSSAHIQPSATSQRGVVALQAFLKYCETGKIQHYSHTGKAADSDFEIAVMDALAQYGYDCEPQLGVTGYFLDIAVRDPKQPGRFLLAIECDGASYHLAKSARDRDRLRQEILENLGWNVHRIWSTDWFSNSAAQINIVLKKLAALREQF